MADESKKNNFQNTVDSLFTCKSRAAPFTYRKDSNVNAKQKKCKPNNDKNSSYNKPYNYVKA